jgi:magnesium chelatase family protein
MSPKDVPPLGLAEMSRVEPGESSLVVRERVAAARSVQAARFADRAGIRLNGGLGGAALRAHCALDRESRALLLRAAERLELSARAYDRVLRVARTVADLEGSEGIGASHVAEALQFRGS